MFKKRENKKLLFKDLSEIWLKSKKIQWKGATIIKYEQLLNLHILPELGGLDVSTIDSVVLNSFLEKKLLNGRIDRSGALSASYVCSMRQTINSIMLFALNEGFYSSSRVLTKGPKIEKKEIRVLEQKNQDKLEEFLREQNSPTNIGILLALKLGLRIGEICALKWSDIDWDTKVLSVKHTVSRIKSDNETSKTVLIINTPKTKYSVRKIPIHDSLISVLYQAYKKSVSPYLVSHKNSFVSPRTFEYRFHKILQTINLPSINFHVLRHTFATRCIECGVDIKSLSEILGHSSVSTTLNIYVHSSMELKRKELDKIYEQ